MAPPMSDSAPLLRLLCVAAAVVAVAEGAQPPKKNVLFFVSDDFRPDTGAYGNPFASTPNLDKLAEEGLLFRAAHVQFAYCAPSRNSFMSGQVLLSPHVYNFLDDFRDPQVGGDKWTSLPEHFKNNGYLVTGSGVFQLKDLVAQWNIPIATPQPVVHDLSV